MGEGVTCALFWADSGIGSAKIPEYVNEKGTEYRERVLVGFLNMFHSVDSKNSQK